MHFVLSCVRGPAQSFAQFSVYEPEQLENIMGLAHHLLLTRSVRAALLLAFLFLLALGIMSGETTLIRIESATL